MSPHTLKSLIEKYAYLSFQLSDQLSLIDGKNKNFPSELDFLEDDTFNLDNTDILVKSIFDLPKQSIYGLFRQIDLLFVASVGYGLRLDRVDIPVREKPFLPQSLLSIFNLFKFYHGFSAL